MEYIYVRKTKEVFPQLTKGLKKVADYLLTDPMIFAIHSAKKVGEIIGVSETMVIRFSHAIEYEGFRRLQSDVRHHVLNLEETAIQNANDMNSSNSYMKSINSDIHAIQKNMDIIEFSKLEDIVETIIKSKRVVVAGYYHSFTFAHWLSFNLNYITENATLYRPETDSTLLKILPKDSCLIVFSFYRYALDTIRLAQEAKEKGITIITITDSRVSPVAEFADITIPIKKNHEANFSNGTVTLSIINSILSKLILRVENSGKIQPTLNFFINNGENNES